MILTFIEVREGKIKKASLEALGEARRCAGDMGVSAAAVLLGERPGADGLASQLFAHGASRVFVLDGPGLAAYSAQGFARALAELVREVSPLAVFLSASAMGRDLAPRLAARLNTALASDCVGVAVKDGRLEFRRPVYAGKAFLTLTLDSTPALATLRPNVFPLRPTPGETGEVVLKTVDVPEAAVKGKVSEMISAPAGEIDVAEAEIIVSGGRGLKEAVNFGLLRELAALLPKAAVGASRSAVDSGWIDHSHQVGQTGKTVSPNLYAAFGISGAIQHLAGMSSSKVIDAVNKDPEAPIFKVADYGIIGDLFQVVPALMDALREAMKE